MNGFFAITLLLAFAAAHAGHIGLEGGYGGHAGHEEVVDYYAPAQYKYDYQVSDSHTGDHKQQWEHRHGDHVQGAYSLVEPDGTTRVVEYTSDPHLGFNAIVKKIGHAHHPQVYAHHAGGEHY